MTPDRLLAQARYFALPLKREFRGVRVRDGLLLPGPSGWAEFAPFHDHTDAHAARWLTAALEQAFGSWPQPVRDRIPVNAIIPEVDADTTGILVAEALAAGCTTIKTKVGRDATADVARVAAIRQALRTAGVDGAIRIDANALWTLAEAVPRLRELAAAAGGLQYVEQPVRDATDLRELRRRSDVPVAVDEGLRMADDPIAAARTLHELGDVAVLKAIPLGGVLAALRVAERVALPVVVSGSLDTSVGLASGLMLAAALPDLPYACGLGTGALLAADVVSAPQAIVAGTLRPLRVEPDPERSIPLAEAGEAGEVWARRVRRAWPLVDRSLPLEHA